MKTRKTEQNARKNYKKSYFLMIVACTILFLTAIGCEKKVDTSLKAQSSIVEYTCISDSDSDKSFYVILKNYHGAYWETVIEGVSKAANEIDASVYLGGIDNETDIEDQIKLIDEAIESGASGILLAPANSDELVESCKKARENGIYVALIDSSINQCEFDACYMTDNVNAGQMAAKEMLYLLKEAGNLPSEELEVGIMLSSDTSQAMINRVSGFLEYWSGHSPAKWEIAQDILEKAQSDAKKLIDQHENLKGIFGCNNTSTIGIAGELLEENREDIVLVGFDMADITVQIIQNPDYFAETLMQRQDQMGYLGLTALHDFVSGSRYEQKYFDTGVVLIDADYLSGRE